MTKTKANPTDTPSAPMSEIRHLMADAPFMVVILREDGSCETRVSYSTDEELRRLCGPAIGMSKRYD